MMRIHLLVYVIKEEKFRRLEADVKLNYDLVFLFFTTYGEMRASSRMNLDFQR